MKRALMCGLLLIASCGMGYWILARSPAPVRPVAKTQVLLLEAPKLQQLVELNIRGTQAVEELKKWYDSTTDDCGGPDKPSNLCSGIALRATASSPDMLPWDPSQKHLDKGSIAFSWVRRDTNFGRPFDRTNGFMFPPVQAVPEGKIKNLDVLCTFPTDGNTDAREAAQGCGPRRGLESTTDACQKVNVKDADDWLKQYSDDDVRWTRICGWDLREEPANMRAEWFEMAVKVRAGLIGNAWVGFNEVLLPVWPLGSGPNLPLQAFFYVEGDHTALVKAQYDQIRYEKNYGQSVPVIRTKFPTDKDQVMVFTYAEEDQAVGRPVPVAKIDFESETVGERKDFVVDGVTFLMANRGGVSKDAHEESEGLISRKHLKFEHYIHIVLPGKGRREVSYHWGCNDHCERYTTIVENGKILSTSSAMRYGTDEFIIEGPEVVTLYIVDDREGLRMVLDNLEIRELSAE
ncbi:hypothetical protein ACIP1G_18350 [Pseudomonas sp. NPDC089392]|uniref:hypothetical protein n=1 Tax=Pseudomonas sp. NPDC089392 TaxID=3364459 RepID=UPI00382AC8DE